MQNPLLIDVPIRTETHRLILRPARRGDGALRMRPSSNRSTGAPLPVVLALGRRGADPDSAEIRCRTCEANFAARTDLPFRFRQWSGGLVIRWLAPHGLAGSQDGSRLLDSSACAGPNPLAGPPPLSSDVRGLFDAVTDEQNLSSRKVADRCGFELEGIHRNVQRAPDGSLRNSCVYARLAVDGQGT